MVATGNRTLHDGDKIQRMSNDDKINKSSVGCYTNTHSHRMSTSFIYLHNTHTQIYMCVSV